MAVVRRRERLRPPTGSSPVFAPPCSISTMPRVLAGGSLRSSAGEGMRHSVPCPPVVDRVSQCFGASNARMGGAGRPAPPSMSVRHGKMDP